RQAADLPGDYREAAPGVTGARRLDRRIQRQQVGLAGDAADEIDDAIDLLRALGQGVDLVRGQIQPAFHLRGLALQLAEVLLVAQRRGGNLSGARLVLAQLSGEKLEGLTQMCHRSAEADQLGRYATVIVELALA